MSENLIVAFGFGVSYTLLFFGMMWIIFSGNKKPRSQTCQRCDGLANGNTCGGE